MAHTLEFKDAYAEIGVAIPLFFHFIKERRAEENDYTCGRLW